MINIAIFASGNGSNAENIIQYFKNNIKFKINLIVTNKNDAFVVQRAIKNNIPHIVFSKKEFENTTIIDILKNKKIDFIILAGFLLKISPELVKYYTNKIVNIHPALLPNYGGKGMYGMNVHKAVIEAQESESGITIHYVNENYDKGSIIFQAKCEISNQETPESLAEKIHNLEYEHFPTEINKILNSIY